MDPHELLVAVGVSGHQHMPDPHLCPELVHVPCAGEDVLVRDAGELLVLLGVDMLDVEHHEIGAPHQPVECREPRRIIIERPARGVEAGVDAVLFEEFEELRDELKLQQRLAAAHRNAALVSPVRLVADGLIHDVLCVPELPLADFPGVGVVAVAAAHAAALHEDDEAHPGPVNGAEGLE